MLAPVYRAVAVALCAAAIGGCTGSHVASTPEPQVVTKEVDKAVPVPCKAMASLGEEPKYPDTDAAIDKAQTIGELSALYAKGRLMRIKRLSEYLTARASCTF